VPTNLKKISNFCEDRAKSIVTVLFEENEPFCLAKVAFYRDRAEM